jgi:hypothetical protein
LQQWIWRSDGLFIVAINGFVGRYGWRLKVTAILSDDFVEAIPKAGNIYKNLPSLFSSGLCSVTKGNAPHSQGNLPDFNKLKLTQIGLYGRGENIAHKAGV